MTGLSGARAPKRLFSIPASAPFLTTLADHLDAGTFGPTAGLARADTTILLPNRRAARAFERLLRDRSQDRAAIQPRIQAIGDADEAGDLTAFADGDDSLADAIDPFGQVPQAMSPLERRLVLTRMILAFGQGMARTLSFPEETDHLLVPVGPADALNLADDLARLFDGFAIEEVAPDRIGDLVPDAYAGYWTVALRFLDIVVREWPAYLTHHGRLDPAARRSRMIRREADRFDELRPDAPIIVAGSTGSIPATARLMDVVSRLPNGAVVLPGLDTHLDAAGWDAIDDAAAPDAGHPQFGLKQLLTRLGCAREDVAVLQTHAPIWGQAREKLFSEVMRPARTTDLWRDRRPDTATIDSALDGMSCLTAETDALEARAIALLMRQALETPGRTAALVTPDRNLSRRVAAELARWGLDVPDSAGRPLTTLPAGTFLLLVAEAAAARHAPDRLAALTGHALFATDTGGTTRDGRAALELLALRGPRPRPGLAGIRTSLERRLSARAAWRHPALTRLADADIEAARALLDTLVTAFGGFDDLDTEGADPKRPYPLRALLDATLTAAETLSADPDAGDRADGRPTTRLDDGRDGAALAGLHAALAETTDIAPDLPLDAWPSVLGRLLQAVTVRPPDGGGPLAIWGPLEARLQAPDLVILGGLNEGVWPSEPPLDPWLSRPMRAALGLSLPERQIGLAAHDIVQAVSAREVVFSRAKRSGGAPTVAARWLQRLATVIGPDQQAMLEARSANVLAWARRLSVSAPDGTVPQGVRPAPVRPCPPVAARPRRFSVTDVETLIRDPYALYARRILDLMPLDPVDAPADAAQRGILVHDVLADLVRGLPDDREDVTPDDLIAAARPHLTALDDMPEVRALWLPRLKRIARFFAAEETALRRERTGGAVETPGQLDIDAPAGTIRLTARADRIDVLRAGGLAIFDYKTGQAPTAKTVRAGLQPQLTLEAAIARAGGFADVSDQAGVRIARLAYVQLTGGLPAGKIVDIVPEDGTLDEMVAGHLDGVRRLIARYDNPDQPYLAKPRVAFRDRASDYDHLSRFADWRDIDATIRANSDTDSDTGAGTGAGTGARARPETGA